MKREAAESRGRRRSVLADLFYYLTNFESVLASLETRYGDLLTEDERGFIRGFAVLPKPSRALLVRMIMRQGGSFRLSRLRYPEIGDAAAAAAPLLDLGWVEEPPLDVGLLHRLLTKAELAAHLTVPGAVWRLSKSDLLDVLRTRSTEPRVLSDWCPLLKDRVFRPAVKPLAERFRLMFFGNLHQDWSAFVLSDLGLSCYETVPIHTAPFRTRVHIDSFYQLYCCHQALQNGSELRQIVANLPPPIVDNDWLEEQRQKLMFRLAVVYERSQDAEAALAMHSKCRFRGSRIRAMRLLERSKEWQSARDLCLIAASSPENGAEGQLVRRMLARLNRKLGIIDENPTKLPAVPSFDISLDAPQDDRALEFKIRDHLARQANTHCTVHYVENGLINSLFGLLCWDAIFAAIPGAFFHHLQRAPADLDSPYFYERRRDEFNECFAQLNSGLYKKIIRQRSRTKAGIQSPFVTWGLLKPPLLEYALQCFPPMHLRLWFEWIVRDVVENRTGFPDLVQFWPNEQRYRLIEIKGPGDRLQDNQRRFLEFCSQHEMPVAVCRVKWNRGDTNGLDEGHPNVMMAEWTKPSSSSGI